MVRIAALCAASLLAQACVSFPDAPPEAAPAVLAGNVIQTKDGALLGMQRWQSADPEAIILAVHGMNDYSNAFALPGAWWAKNAQITTYAYDQRGFGRSPGAGRWFGAETMKSDLRSAVAAVRAAHPDLPIFVLGHSMGAATVLAAEADASLGAEGIIIASPGVWGGGALPLPYRVAVNVAAAVAPGKTLTGERADRQATDNLEILRQMWFDPLVIKETRIDAILGVVRLMGDGYKAAPQSCANALILIGEHDEIIPRKVMNRTAGRYCGEKDVRYYENGWHMLFRDLEGETVWRDVVSWIDQQGA